MELAEASRATSDVNSEYGFRHQRRKWSPASFTKSTLPERLSPVLNEAPCLGSKFVIFLGRVSQLSEDRDAMAHSHSPEQVLEQIQRFKRRQLMDSLQRVSIFAFDLLRNAGLFAEHLLGPIRIVQLAALGLEFAKDDLWYEAGEPWVWLEWYDKVDSGVKDYVDSVVVKSPGFGGKAVTFAANADGLMQRALNTGPKLPAINRTGKPDGQDRTITKLELQEVVQLGCEHMFDPYPSVREAEPFAAAVLSVIVPRLCPP